MLRAGGETQCRRVAGVRLQVIHGEILGAVAGTYQPALGIAFGKLEILKVVPAGCGLVGGALRVRHAREPLQRLKPVPLQRWRHKRAELLTTDAGDAGEEASNGFDLVEVVFDRRAHAFGPFRGCGLEITGQRLPAALAPFGEQAVGQGQPDQQHQRGHARGGGVAIRDGTFGARTQPGMHQQQCQYQQPEGTDQGLAGARGSRGDLLSDRCAQQRQRLAIEPGQRFVYEQRPVRGGSQHGFSSPQRIQIITFQGRQAWVACRQQFEGDLGLRAQRAQQFVVEKAAEDQHAAGHTGSACGHDRTCGEQQQAILGGQNTAVGFLPRQPRRQHRPDRRRLAGKCCRRQKATQLSVIAATVEDLAVAREDETEIQPRVFFQQAPVAEIGGDESGVAAGRKRVGVVPLRPVTQLFAEFAQLAIDCRARARRVLESLCLFDLDEGRPHDPAVERPDGEQGRQKSQGGGQDRADARVHALKCRPPGRVPLRRVAQQGESSTNGHRPSGRMRREQGQFPRARTDSALH
jgi:hypothetical protein